MPLCEVCAAIDLGAAIEKACQAGVVTIDNYEFLRIAHQSVEALNAAADNGCELCKLLRSSTDPEIQEIRPPPGTGESFYFALERVDTDTQDVAEYPFTYACTGATYVSFTGEWASPERETYIHSLAFTIIAGDPAYLNREDHSRGRGPELWKAWMHNCSRFHTGCHRLQVQRPAPSRLLYCGSGIDKIRLVEERGSQKHYVALSHCWGTEPFLKTTCLTLAAMLCYVPWKDLPRTFREAITVTVDLGFEFIWIDSLCIVQDDKLDWQRECASMGDVYSNAAVVLAANAGSDASSGLSYHDRHPDFPSDQCSLTVKWPTRGTTAVVKIRKRSSTTEPPWRGRVRGPLTERGWAMQERLLAPRVLQFHKGHTEFECATSVRFEGLSFPLEPDFSVVPSGVPKTILQPSYRFRYRDGLGTWYDLVETFAGCRLTHDGDRLAAISGIARQIRNNMKREMRYCAGLWDIDVAVGLAWFSRNGEKLSTIPARLPAPSWSWASYDRGIHYGDAQWYQVIETTDWQRLWTEVTPDFPPSTFVSCLETHDIAVTPAGADEYGELLDGKLTVSGMTRRVKLEPDESGEQLRLRCASRQTVLTNFTRDDFEDRTAILEPLVALLLGFQPKRGVQVIVLRASTGENRVFQRVGASIIGDSEMALLGTVEMIAHDHIDPPIKPEEALEWMLQGEYRRLELI